MIAAIGAVLFGVLAMMIVFSRRAQKAAFKPTRGSARCRRPRPVMLRRGWTTDEVVAFTKQQDMVHRVVGPPGIVLVGEGNPNRVKTLMASERRKHERVAAETPIHEVVVGNGEGEVPLPKLVRHVQKLGREREARRDHRRPQPDQGPRRPAGPRSRMPRGPVPTSMKGMRGNMRGR